LAEVRACGGAYGLIRYNAQILPILEIKNYLKILELNKKIFYLLFYFYAGAAWLSSVRVVRCLVNSLNERNSYKYNK
jgi:hypothetical protein